MNIFDELEWRGLIHSSTEGSKEYLSNNLVKGYIGFDPTAPSLHVGSLLPIMNLVRLQRFGHTPIAVAGGGTGMIGDPSGKTQERQLLSTEKVQENLEGIKKQLAKFLDFSAKENKAIMVNNADWLCTITLIDFLRDIGKYFTIGYLTAKESVKMRMESEQGISFTEFSYILLQAYDFLMLYDKYNCTLQMGGSDQWGNITAGIDLIRKLRGKEVYGIVSPLIVSSTGVKFGKTESGTIWLDEERTSPYRFYQFWFNTDDRDVIKYLKYFTLLDKSTIDELEESLKTSPEKRMAQKRLATEVTALVHGQSALDKAERASRILFGEEITDIDEKEVIEIFGDVPSSEISKDSLSGEGIPLADLFVSSSLSSSKGDAKRLIKAGGAYLNNRRITDIFQKVNIDNSIRGRFLVLRKGSKEYHLIKIVN